MIGEGVTPPILKCITPPCRSFGVLPRNFPLPINHSNRLKPRKAIRFPFGAKFAEPARLSEPRTETLTRLLILRGKNPSGSMRRGRPFPALVLQLQRLLNLLSSNCSLARWRIQARTKSRST